jgi:hypothetical protein
LTNVGLDGEVEVVKTTLDVWERSRDEAATRAAEDKLTKTIATSADASSAFRIFAPSFLLSHTLTQIASCDPSSFIGFRPLSTTSFFVFLTSAFTGSGFIFN